jgi:hypothetical protein
LVFGIAFPRQPFSQIGHSWRAIAGIIYWLAHLEDWSGYEIGGIALFQAVILSTGLCLVGGEFKLAAIILGVSVIALAILASIAKGL